MNLLCSEVPESRAEPHLRRKISDMFIASNVECGEIGELRDECGDYFDAVVAHI